MLRGKKSVKIDEQLEDNRMAVGQKTTNRAFVWSFEIPKKQNIQ